MRLKKYIKPFVGKGHSGREQALIRMLESVQIPFVIHSYRHEREEHRNYLFSLGKEEPGILLCAHYDAFPDCPGANDNASGIAVLLGLYHKLKKQKLHQKVTFALFDQEEIGCIGSRAFAEKTHDFSAVISLELVGYGDVMGLWPITKDTQIQPVYQTLLTLLKEKHILCETAGELPVFYADFSPFREKGVRDSFCITMIPKQEVPFIRKVIKNPSILSIRLQTGMGLPLFFQYYHSEQDTLKIIREKALENVQAILLELIGRRDKPHAVISAALRTVRSKRGKSSPRITT